MMEYITAGESHGPCLTVIVNGVPAGIVLTARDVRRDLARRRLAPGRSVRQCVERDEVEVTGGVRVLGRAEGSVVTACKRELAGAYGTDVQEALVAWCAAVEAGERAAAGELAAGERVAAEGPAIEERAAAPDWFGVTTGAPVALVIPNACAADVVGDTDDAGADEPQTSPRPGHADLCGVLKTGICDCRNTSERASARETAARVAAGAVAKAFLAALGVAVNTREPDSPSPSAIEAARDAGQTLGGVFTLRANGLVPGLGGYACGTERLTSKLGAALFGIPAVKAVEFGLGTAYATAQGAACMDEILPNDLSAQTETNLPFSRRTNFSGGLEGGMTTGMPLDIRVTVKPIPTQPHPLRTVDIATGEATRAALVRSDVCAVHAAAIVGEAEVAFVLANAYVQKFGGDCVNDTKVALAAYSRRLQALCRSANGEC